MTMLMTVGNDNYCKGNNKNTSSSRKNSNRNSSSRSSNSSSSISSSSSNDDNDNGIVDDGDADHNDNDGDDDSNNYSTMKTMIKNKLTCQCGNLGHGSRPIAHRSVWRTSDSTRPDPAESRPSRLQLLVGCCPAGWEIRRIRLLIDQLKKLKERITSVKKYVVLH